MLSHEARDGGQYSENPVFCCPKQQLLRRSMEFTFTGFIILPPLALHPRPSPPPATFLIGVLSFSRISTCFTAVLPSETGADINDSLFWMETERKWKFAKTKTKNKQRANLRRIWIQNTNTLIHITDIQTCLSKEWYFSHLSNFRRKSKIIWPNLSHWQRGELKRLKFKDEPKMPTSEHNFLRKP